MPWPKLLLTFLVGVLVAVGFGYVWGASGRSAAEDAVENARQQLDLTDARSRILHARVSLYNNNFGDASGNLEEAKAPLRRLRDHYDDTDRRDAVAAIDTALKHVEEAQRLAGKLDAAANSRANDAMDALKVLGR